MENEKAETPKPEEANGADRAPEARCWIDKGIMRVEIPLFMQNGEFIAYGMLHKAQGIAAGFFAAIERETKKDDSLRQRILTPTGTPGIH